MNTVYKVVWNRVRNAYIVAGEFVKSHGKSASTKALTSALAAMALTGALALPAAYAEDTGAHYYSVMTDKKDDSSNYKSDTAKAEDSLVLDIASSSDGVNTTVIGHGNKLSGQKNGKNNSIVAGQGLTVEGADNSIFGTGFSGVTEGQKQYYRKTLVAGDNNIVLGAGNLAGYTAEESAEDPASWTYKKSHQGTNGKRCHRS